MTLPIDRKDREYNKFDDKNRVKITGSEDLIIENHLADLNCKMEKLIDIISCQDENVGSRGVISDGRGSKERAKVTSRGQLITAPVEYSEMYSNTSPIINIATNIVPPISGKHFVITDIVLTADKNVGPNGVSIQIYEADSATSTTTDKILYQQEMVKDSTVPLTGLNIIMNKGKWLNIKIDDNIVYSNIGGYYVDEEIL